MSYFVPVSTAVRDAFLGEDATAKFVRVVIDPAGTPVTFVPIDLSCDASEEYQKWSFTLKNRAGLSVGLYANEPCVVQVSHNNSDWVTSFTGFVSDDGFSRIRGALVDDYVSLELVDATKRKGTKRKPSPAILSNFKTANLANTSTSILHYLASLMGVSVETSDITQTHELIEIGKKTVWAELQSLRDAFHADMYFRFDGKLLFRSPLEDAYSAPASEWTFQGDPSEAVTGNACRIVGKLSEAFLAVRCNYAKTSFVDYEQLTSRVIYKHTHNIDEASGYITVEIAPNSYWPGPHAGDVAKLKFADPESGEDYPFAVSVVTPAIGAYGSGSAIEATGGNLTLVSFNGSTSATSHEAGAAQIILYNNSSSTCTLRKLTITGEPYRKESDVKVEHVDASVSDAIDYVEQSVDGSYMVSSTQAFDTLYHIVEEGKGRPRRFGFSAPFMPWIQRRAIVMVQPPGESVVRCRIDTYSHKKSGRTLQGMRTAITCTELGTHVPSGSPSTVTIPTPSPSSPPMPSLSVRPSSNVIIINNRNGLTTAVISFTLSASAIDAANVTWAATDGTLTKVDDTQYTLDCSTVSGTSSTITVSASYNATVYQFATTVTKVYENLPVANLRGVTTVPTTTPDGDGLITGDYFLWAGATDATYTKGKIYEYNGTEWVESTNGDLVMTMFDSFADLANDVDSTVIGNAVIKKLVAIDAVVQNLVAQNLKVGIGDSEEVEFDAIECNGSSSYAETSAFAIAGADRTFEMWIKPVIINSYTGLFIQNTNANDSSSNNIVGFQGYPGSSNEITLAIGSSSAYYITGKVALPTGVWTHLAGVIEGGVSAKVYLNGNLLINEAISISPSTGSLKVIMGRIMDKYLGGMCRDFRIWNTVRTQQQIQDNMLADLVGNESGLIALWKANEMTGATLIDSVGSNDATATGISWVTDIGVIGGTGFKFTAVQDDGTGKPRFDVYYNGERVFEANPQNGKVYFGNNFWYDPADSAIHTPNNKTVINADGTIEAVDGVFSGTVNAEQGVFKGSIDSSAFASLPSSSGTTDDIILTSSEAYQVNTVVDYCQTTLTVNKYYACSATIDSSVEYIRYSGSGTDVYIYFYNSSFIRVAEMRRLYGTFGWAYHSDYKGSSLTVSVSYGAGDVFKFKNLPTSASGLASGQVWRDGTTLKIVT